MTQQRINNLLLLHVHKNRTNNLSMRKIAEEFVSDNSRRMIFFEHF